MSTSIPPPFSDTKKVEYLFKRSLNVPCTSSNLEFFQEPSTTTTRNFVYQEDIISSRIPNSTPSDIKNLTDNDKDDNGFVLPGSYAGKTSLIDPNIRYYHKLPMEAIAGSNGAAFQTINAGIWSHPGGYGDGVSATNLGRLNNKTYGRTMQGSIPFNYSTNGSYSVKLYKNVSGRPGPELPFGIGGAVIDARPGIITFFTLSDSMGISESSPPFVSFFRYIGGTGGVIGSQVSEIITTETNEFTAKQVFVGGGSDQMTAIQVDNRDISILSSGELMDSIQWGPNNDGSWRVTVQKTESGSQFLVQARENSQWITKTTFTSP